MASFSVSAHFGFVLPAPVLLVDAEGVDLVVIGLVSCLDSLYLLSLVDDDGCGAVLGLLSALLERDNWASSVSGPSPLSSSAVKLKLSSCISFWRFLASCSENYMNIYRC